MKFQMEVANTARGQEAAPPSEKAGKPRAFLAVTLDPHEGAACSRLTFQADYTEANRKRYVVGELVTVTIE